MEVPVQELWSLCGRKGRGREKERKRKRKRKERRSPPAISSSEEFKQFPEKRKFRKTRVTDRIRSMARFLVDFIERL